IIKLVAQVIPSYCMSVFLLPTTLQDEMQSMMNSFRWDSNRNVGKKSIGLVGNVFLRKELGVKKEFKAKYYPNCNFLDSALGYSPSFTWHSIHTSRVLVKNGIRWRLKDGKSINIW
ncbi:hypothetical protein glysoja_030385, partial [Glycine soja]